MGNRIGNLCQCSTGAGEISGRFDKSIPLITNQHDRALGDSICYVRPDACRFSSDTLSDDDNDVTPVTFRSVSGATVSANSSSTPSACLDDSHQQNTLLDSSASFESSGSFTSATRMMVNGGFVKSPCDRALNGGNIEKDSETATKKKKKQQQLQKSLSDSGCGFQNKPRRLKKILSEAFSKTVLSGKRSFLKNNGNGNGNARVSCSTSLSGELRLQDDGYGYGGGGCDVLEGCKNLHWAQGRAGEDRMHVVICEDHGWVFVGIYDGFNGPDATDFLLDNLFCAVHDELKEILCSHKHELMDDAFDKRNGVDDDGFSSSFNKENHPMVNENLNFDDMSNWVEGMNNREVAMKWECEKDGGESDLERMMKVNLSLAEAKIEPGFGHSDVLQALSEALRKIEDSFLKSTEDMIAHSHNPVLAMMGSCVLVMLMKGEDVYLMNVGDSRAVLATQAGNSLQLTMEHSTHVKEEVHRIRREHPDDPSAVTKGRVKGYLSVTRAFGAGFLKQPKQNSAVLETFQVDYIGDSPYITCCPSLHHHRLSPNDKFVILSSDGLYQYFTNEEAVAKVESFISMFPDRDPAQLLIEEALTRAAKRAGLNFHELIAIPEGERRIYHDDISVVIISLEGKIWRSLV